MNITPVAVPQASGNDSTSSTGTTGLPTSQGLNNMFLQLLVAQLQNQSPLNPMDPTQFVGQLAQFSELSEVTQIAQTLQQIVPAKSGSAGSPSNNSASPTQPAQAAAPNPWISSAVSVAQAEHPPSSPARSILNNSIQGVF